MIERNILASTHGRYLIAKANPGSPLLVGFHGYAESAEHEYRRLNSIPGAEQWTRVAVQGLHRFYRGASRDVVASWMTSQDRELAVTDNCAYVASVIESVVAEQSPSPILVFHGFSQGVGMALRAATSSSFRVRGVMVSGGDVPPELDSNSLAKIQSVLLGRGTEDPWYTEEKLAADERRLRDAGTSVRTIRFQAGHEWTPEFRRAAGDFLEVCRPQHPPV
jgi:predicted esterase